MEEVVIIFVRIVWGGNPVVVERLVHVL